VVMIAGHGLLDESAIRGSDAGAKRQTIGDP
jgi:hypothetical protein